MLLTATAHAQWDTNAWSGAYERYYVDASTNRVYIKDVFKSDTTNAIAERLVILENIFDGGFSPDVSFTPATGWFRTERAHLNAAKTWISTVAPFFIDTTQTNSFGRVVFTNAYNDYVSRPFWTTADLLSDAGAPTNYLSTSATPWRNLKSVELGWKYIPEIFNRLVWLSLENLDDDVVYEYYNTNAISKAVNIAYGTYTNYADFTNAAVTAWGSASPGTDTYTTRWESDRQGSFFFGDLYRSAEQFAHTNMTEFTNSHFALDMYVTAIADIRFTNTTYFVWEGVDFPDAGLTTSNGWEYAASSSPTNSAYVLSEYFGDTNLPIPEVAPEPPASGASSESIRGWQDNFTTGAEVYFITIIRYDVPNGFLYVAP